MLCVFLTTSYLQAHVEATHVIDHTHWPSPTLASHNMLWIPPFHDEDQGNHCILLQQHLCNRK